MKKGLLTLLILGIASTAFAQDVIKARNGARIKAKVLEITPTEIFWQATGKPDSPVFRAYRYEIVWIKFRNGTYEYLNPDPVPQRNRTVTAERTNPSQLKTLPFLH